MTSSFVSYILFRLFIHSVQELYILPKDFENLFSLTELACVHLPIPLFLVSFMLLICIFDVPHNQVLHTNFSYLSEIFIGIQIVIQGSTHCLEQMCRSSPHVHVALCPFGCNKILQCLVYFIPAFMCPIMRPFPCDSNALFCKERTVHDSVTACVRAWIPPRI